MQWERFCKQILRLPRYEESGSIHGAAFLLSLYVYANSTLSWPLSANVQEIAKAFHDLSVTDDPTLYCSPSDQGSAAAILNDELTHYRERDV